MEYYCLPSLKSQFSFRSADLCMSVTEVIWRCVSGRKFFHLSFANLGFKWKGAVFLFICWCLTTFRFAGEELFYSSEAKSQTFVCLGFLLVCLSLTSLCCFPHSPFLTPSFFFFSLSPLTSFPPFCSGGLFLKLKMRNLIKTLMRRSHLIQVH